MTRAGAKAGLCAALLAAALGASDTTAPQRNGFPYTDEALEYTINWPTGLSLGQARLHARKQAAKGWEFELQLDAAIPGYTVEDRYRSLASLELCSLEFDKNFTHGSRKAREKMVFDYRKSVARRTTVGGGKSDIPIADCARDALDFVFFARRELGQGRLPAAQAVLFGSPYQTRLEYTGAQVVSVNDKKMEADHVSVALKGPKADLNFEIFFARDAARTPLVVRVPFSLGTFSMELVR